MISRDCHVDSPEGYEQREDEIHGPIVELPTPGNNEIEGATVIKKPRSHKRQHNRVKDRCAITTKPVHDQVVTNHNAEDGHGQTHADNGEEECG
jgi:hypothetical protein